MIATNKKLLEVALPLGEINKEASREKSLRHGHPSTLHLWWSRKPLAVARAMLFAQLVDDPDDKEKRAELFALLKKLVRWENSDNQQLLKQARKEITASWQKTCHANRKHPQAETLFDPNKLPAFCDPFAGGGAIPLEAQRLGLKAYASDLNPIAVLINKAMLELPTKVRKITPSQLAQDVERYGKIVRTKAYQKIGNLYPPVTVKNKKLTVIAYLWARTVKSPNPAYRQCDVPLLSTYILSKKKGNETYLKPIVTDKKFHFEIIKGQPPDWAKNGTKVGRGNFQCLLSGTAIPVAEIRRQGKAGLMGSRMTAIVADNQPGRVYLAPPATS